jgi:hypothetical protein
MKTARTQVGFEPRDLPGWWVARDDGPRSRGWVFLPPANFPNAFSWSDAAQDHVVPVLNDWAGPYSGPNCSTASQAVAAAHKHNRGIRDHIAAKGIVVEGMDS